MLTVELTLLEQQFIFLAFARTNHILEMSWSLLTIVAVLAGTKAYLRVCLNLTAPVNMNQLILRQINIGMQQLLVTYKYV